MYLQFACTLFGFTALALMTDGLEDLYQESDLAGKKLVFVSGWPQSGTSLVQQILTVAPLFSTMVNSCHEKIGKSKCERWNNEGQWLLGKAPLSTEKVQLLEISKSLLLPGAMCVPSEDSLKTVATQRSSLRELLLSQWSYFWDMKSSFLTEKSPQFMLKIPLLREIFLGSKSRSKYLIVIKHPASLNIAVPKSIDWLTHDLAGDESTPKKKIPNSHRQLSENIDYFLDFLSHGEGQFNASLAKLKNRRECSLGWIPAMEQLALQLNTSRHDSLTDVRILRYEQFERPTVVCRAIFDFLFDDDLEGYRNAVKSVCDVHFPIRTRVTTSTLGSRSARESVRGGGSTRSKSTGRTGIPRRLGEESSDRSMRRQLRLHTLEASSSDELVFRPTAITQSVHQRLQNYFALYRHTAISDTQRAALDQLDIRIKSFGYRISPKNNRERLQIETVFDDFDLIINYHRRKLDIN